MEEAAVDNNPLLGQYKGKVILPRNNFVNIVDSSNFAVDTEAVFGYNSNP